MHMYYMKLYVLSSGNLNTMDDSYLSRHLGDVFLFT